MEQTLVLIKPDGVLGKKIGRVIRRFEDKGLKIQALKMIWLDEDLAKTHYQQHIEREFFDRLLSYITEAPVVVMVVAGQGAIAVVRNLVGRTNPAKAQPGTIRGDFALNIEAGNIIHASDSKKSAEREIDLFFTVDEIYSYSK